MVELFCDASPAETGGLHVLIEAPEWSRRQALSQVVERAGHMPVACPGPSGQDERCGFAAGGTCHAAEQADVVVHVMPHHDLRNLELWRALRARYPQTPLIVEVPAVVAERHPDDYEGAVVIHAPMSASALVDALGDIT